MFDRFRAIKCQRQMSDHEKLLALLLREVRKHPGSSRRRLERRLGTRFGTATVYEMVNHCLREGLVSCFEPRGALFLNDKGHAQLMTLNPYLS